MYKLGPNKMQQIFIALNIYRMSLKERSMSSILELNHDTPEIHSW